MTMIGALGVHSTDPVVATNIQAINRDTLNESPNDSFTPPLFDPSIRYGMDTTISPCIDFYAYANGGWRAKARMTSSPQGDRKLVDAFSDITKRGRIILERYIDSVTTIRASVTTPTGKLIATFVASCLSADSIDIQIGIRGRTAPDSSRRARCMERAFKYLPIPLGQQLANTLIPPQTQARVDTMLTAIRTAAINRFKKNTWLSDNDRAVAIDRFERLHFRVGLPVNMIDYGALNLTEDYHRNIVAIKEYEYNARLKTIGNDSRKVTKMGFLMANAFYAEGEHSLEIPPLLFMLPFFAPKADDAVNFGGIGLIIGHEAFHSIALPWTRRRDSIFIAKWDEYMAFQATLGELDNWRVSPKLTLGEDLADLGGVLVAYDAWKAITPSKTSPLIDGFTPDQRFFIAIAQVWRAKWVGDTFSNNHGAPFARVHSMITNSPAFAKAFGCQESDPMVLKPEKRPVIW